MVRKSLSERDGKNNCCQTVERGTAGKLVRLIPSINFFQISITNFAIGGFELAELRIALARVFALGSLAVEIGSRAVI